MGGPLTITQQLGYKTQPWMTASVPHQGGNMCQPQVTMSVSFKSIEWSMRFLSLRILEKKKKEKKTTKWSGGVLCFNKKLEVSLGGPHSISEPTSAWGVLHFREDAHIREHQVPSLHLLLRLNQIKPSKV